MVTAKRDAYVAGFQLLNAMGQAQAQDLGLDGGPLYDPLGNYRHVANNWNDWASDPRHPTDRDAHRVARRRCRPIRWSLRSSIARIARRRFDTTPRRVTATQA